MSDDVKQSRLKTSHHGKVDVVVSVVAHGPDTHECERLVEVCDAWEGDELIGDAVCRVEDAVNISSSASLLDADNAFITYNSARKREYNSQFPN